MCHVCQSESGQLKRVWWMWDVLPGPLREGLLVPPARLSLLLSVPWDSWELLALPSRAQARGHPGGPGRLQCSLGLARLSGTSPHHPRWILLSPPLLPFPLILLPGNNTNRLCFAGHPPDCTTWLSTAWATFFRRYKFPKLLLGDSA